MGNKIVNQSFYFLIFVRWLTNTQVMLQVSCRGCHSFASISVARVASRCYIRYWYFLWRHFTNIYVEGGIGALQAIVTSLRPRFWLRGTSHCYERLSTLCAERSQYACRAHVNKKSLHSQSDSKRYVNKNMALQVIKIQYCSFIASFINF